MGMYPNDWRSSSFTTNIAESAHAAAQREGTKLSLLAAVQRGKQVDSRFLRLEEAAFKFGVTPRYGNTSVSGRKKDSVSRKRSKGRKKVLKEIEEKKD